MGIPLAATSGPEGAPWAGPARVKKVYVGEDPKATWPYPNLNYQEEMEKREPNAETAGAYLGLVATRPVTEDVVARTNAILCVTSSAKLATQIAATAEQERKVTQQ